MPPLTPPDPERCQTMVSNGNSFMTLGGRPGLVRCTNKPAVIITETQPAEDGQIGSMSLCDECEKVFDARMPAGFATKRAVFQTHTRFMDMHSGGSQKLDFSKLYVPLPEKEAIAWFQNRYGRDPNNVTCGCCGEDYVVYELSTQAALDEYLAYDRRYDGKPTVLDKTLKQIVEAANTLGLEPQKHEPPAHRAATATLRAIHALRT